MSNTTETSSVVNVEKDILQKFVSANSLAMLTTWTTLVSNGVDLDEAMHTTNIFLVAQAEIACEKAGTKTALNRAAIDKVKEVILSIGEE